MGIIEILLKVLGLITASAAVIGLVVKLVTKVVKKYKQVMDYETQISDLKNEFTEFKTNTRTQFQTVLTELALQTDAINATLDGLMQLGCNHTVPDAKKAIEEYLKEQTHQVKEL